MHLPKNQNGKQGIELATLKNDYELIYLKAIKSIKKGDELFALYYFEDLEDKVKALSNKFIYFYFKSLILLILNNNKIREKKR